MRVGIVCPYTWDVPGGVQEHVRDLAEALIDLGHQVSVISPADDDSPLPRYVVPAGRAVPVPYNGSVARLAFGFLSAGRVRRWGKDGRFDVLHVHEPVVPSLSLLACWVASGPIVATVHTANPRSRWMHAARPALQSALEKLSARIAVSEAARTTLVEHLGGDAVLIPNGVSVRRYEKADPLPGWPGPGGSGSSFSYLRTETPFGMSTASPPRCSTRVVLAASETAILALSFSSADCSAGRAACIQRERGFAVCTVATIGPEATQQASNDRLGTTGSCTCSTSNRPSLPHRRTRPADR